MYPKPPKKPLPSKHIADKRGQVFGRLTVIEYAGKNYHSESQWLCKCDCGKEVVVLTGQLMAGQVKSCGCLKIEVDRTRSRTHGKTGTRLFNIWQGMRARCNNPNETSYKYYGARGITVCHEWDLSFETFYNWSVLNGYRSDLTIDRINVNGNYEPSNCRWATIKQQANNTSKNHIIVIDGVSKTISEWSDCSGVKWTTIKERWRRGDCGYDLIRPIWRAKINVF